MNSNLKNSIFLLFLVLSSFTASAQDTLQFENYKKMTDFLFEKYSRKYTDLSFFKYKRINGGTNIYDDYKGTLEDPQLDVLQYLSLINNIDISNCQANEHINLKNIQDQMINGALSSVVPLSVVFIEYSDVNGMALYQNYVRFENNQLQDYSPAGFEMFTKDHLFAASPLNQVINSQEVSFKFSDEVLLTNVSIPDGAFLEVDFGDGNGLVTLLKNEIMSVSYPTVGDKDILIKMTINDKIYYSKSKIIIGTPTDGETLKAGGSVLPPNIGPVVITTNKLGRNVSGRYAVWLSDCNGTGKIRKPYIISAGFNPGSGKQLVPLSVAPMDLTFSINGNNVVIPVSFSWRGTYYETYNGTYNANFSPSEYSAYGSSHGNGASNGTRYLDRLRDEGYDIIILMYDNGTDYAVNNAALFMELIEQINVQKFNNGSYFENVVSGYSAGGVATKLALSLMESRYKQGKGPNPHTRIWVSIETENQGAIIPLGFQHLVKFQSNPSMLLPLAPSGLNFLQVAADQINQIVASIAHSFNFNPSANELMKYNALMSTNGMHPDRINLLNMFSTIPLNTTRGYPDFCRRVGVSQGSSIGTQVPHNTIEIFDTKLKWNIFGDSYTYTTCDGTYTAYRPVTEKRTTAKWWGSINPSGNVFDGYVAQSTRWTITQRYCWSFHIPFFGNVCVCFPSLEFSGTQVVIGNTHIPKPTAEPNLDDVPASTQPYHKDLRKFSAYSFYNNWFAGNAFAHNDSSLHSFAPTVSCLDLRDANTGQPVSNFTSPASLNLMKINPTTFQPDVRYGFPFLSYSNPFPVTPYHGVYAIGKNNGTYMDGTPKPGNQYHVEDPQSMIGDYLARIEVAPETLFLSNRTVGTNIVTSFGYYPAEFEARKMILVGKNDDTGVNSIYSKYANQNYLTPDGDFTVNEKAKVIVHAGNQIEFLPGTNVVLNGELSAYIDMYDCDNKLYRSGGPTENTLPGYMAPTNTSYEAMQHAKGKAVQTVTEEATFSVYPNPNNGVFTLETNVPGTLTVNVVNAIGETITRLTVEELRTVIDLRSVPKGIYLLDISNGSTKTVKKIIIQ